VILLKHCVIKCSIAFAVLHRCKQIISSRRWSGSYITVSIECLIRPYNWVNYSYAMVFAVCLPINELGKISYSVKRQNISFY